jgi:hypothetical protein
VPAAIAAKLVHPERKVVTVNGDGGFLMNCQELETAVRIGTPFVNVIWENSQYGSIVWKQDKKFGRHFGTDFTNPDFVKLAEAFGAVGAPPLASRSGDLPFTGGRALYLFLAGSVLIASGIALLRRKPTP